MTEAMNWPTINLNRLRGYSRFDFRIETLPGPGLFGSGGHFVVRFEARDHHGALQAVRSAQFERGRQDLNVLVCTFLESIPELNQAPEAKEPGTP